MIPQKPASSHLDHFAYSSMAQAQSLPQKSLQRAKAFFDLSEAEAPVSRPNTVSELFEKQVENQNPLFQKYQAFIRSVDDGMTVEEEMSFLQFVEDHLPAWISKKQAVYLKKSEHSGLVRTVEYDPRTAEVYTHCKGRRGILLGEGSFAKVTESLVVQTGLKLANKTYHKEPQVYLEPHEREAMLKEGEKHLALHNCQHVVKVYRISEKGLLLEHMNMGSLLQLLLEGYEFSSEEKARVVEQAINGMCEIHQHGFVHKDIKLDNVLLNDTGMAKLADLGTLSVVGQKMRANRGNPLSWSPQIWESWVENKQHESRPEDDMWAMGMLLYELELGLNELPSFTKVLEKLVDVCKKRDLSYRQFKTMPSPDTDETSKRAYEEHLRENAIHHEEARTLYQNFIVEVKAFEAEWEVSSGTLCSLIKEMLRLKPAMRCSDAKASAFSRLA